MMQAAERSHRSVSSFTPVSQTLQVINLWLFSTGVLTGTQTLVRTQFVILTHLRAADG